MAEHVKEVEIKAKINNRELLDQKFDELGIVLGETKYQKDFIYVNFDDDYAPFPKDKHTLRLRESGDKCVLTLKQCLPGHNLVKIEKEAEVADREKMADIIEYLGYHKAVEVEKTRRKAKFGDLEICVDEITGLGSFIEIERLTTDEDIEKIRAELFDFLLKLGVNKEDSIDEGYDIMIWKRLNNK